MKPYELFIGLAGFMLGYTTALYFFDKINAWQLLLADIASFIIPLFVAMIYAYIKSHWKS